jgi:hypothetical protein
MGDVHKAGTTKKREAKCIDKREGYREQVHNRGNKAGWGTCLQQGQRKGRGHAHSRGNKEGWGTCTK